MDDKKTVLFHGGQHGVPNPASPGGGPRRPEPAPPARPAAGPPPAAPPVAYPPAGPPQGHAGPPQGYAGPPRGYPQAPRGAPPQGGPPPGWQGQPGRPPQPAPAPGPARGSQGGAPGWGNFAAYGSGGGVSRLKIFGAIGGALLVAALSIGGYFLKDKFLGKKTARGAVSYRSLGVDDLEHVDPDALIGALEQRTRRRWKRDASWWSVDVRGFRPDGTIDLTSSAGTLEYVSPGGVQSAAKSRRRDSIKRYSLTARGATSNRIIGARKPWKDFEPPPAPGCKLADLSGALRKRGFKSGTVRISFDPKFTFASGWAWHVWSKDATIAGYYSMSDCSFVKKAPS